MLSREQIDDICHSLKDILATLADGGAAAGKSAEQVRQVREEAPKAIDDLRDMALQSLRSPVSEERIRDAKSIERIYDEAKSVADCDRNEPYPHRAALCNVYEAGKREALRESAAPRNGAQCADCGFSYAEHNGHIIACPVCALERGTGTVNDAAPGDIDYKEWPCPDCSKVEQTSYHHVPREDSAVSQGKPDAWMFYIRYIGKGKWSEFAAIDYTLQDGEELLSKRPLYLAPAQSAQQGEPYCWMRVNEYSQSEVCDESHARAFPVYLAPAQPAVEWPELLRKKLKKASAGEPNTWGFVAMFMDMIDETENELRAAHIAALDAENKA